MVICDSLHVKCAATNPKEGLLELVSNCWKRRACTPKLFFNKQKWSRNNRSPCEAMKVKRNLSDDSTNTSQQRAPTSVAEGRSVCVSVCLCIRNKCYISFIQSKTCTATWEMKPKEWQKNAGFMFDSVSHQHCFSLYSLDLSWNVQNSVPPPPKNEGCWKYLKICLYCYIC